MTDLVSSQEKPTPIEARSRRVANAVDQYSTMTFSHRIATSMKLDKMLLVVLLTVSVSISTTMVVMALQLSDEERRNGFAARNYTWPIPEGHMVPSTPGWDRLMRRRIRQVEALQATTRTEKFDAWTTVMAQALVVPNFTQFGWAVVKAPSELTNEIQEALRAGMETAWEEHDIAIVGDSPPVMVDMPEMIDKTLTRLHPYHEAWAGIPLKKQKGYGLRVYKNNSQLYMHLDKFETHIISCIFHIDHSEDAQPWPLVIEDLEGTTQNVYLERGDMLLYESAKCLHGRPIPFHGSWYTSLFLHYSPQDWPFEEEDWAAQYAIPDHWEEQRDFSPADMEEYGGNLPHLTVVDTAMYEGDCPNIWCGSELTSPWAGTAKSDVAITSHGKEQALNLSDSISNTEGDEL